MAEYEIFLIKDLSDLKDGQEQILDVRNLVDYEIRTVKAIVSSSPEKLLGADTLWLRWQRGQRHPKPWAIKILEDKGTTLGEVAKEWL